MWNRWIITISYDMMIFCGVELHVVGFGNISFDLILLYLIWLNWIELNWIWLDWIQFDLIWFDLILLDLIWFDLIWFDLIWFDLNFIWMIWTLLSSIQFFSQLSYFLFPIFILLWEFESFTSTMNFFIFKVALRVVSLTHSFTDSL